MACGSGEVRGEDAALAATWQQAAAGFQGAPDDVYSFDLSGSLRLGGASATYLSTKVGQKERYPLGGLLSALPLRFERSGSGRVATAAGGLGWSLQYGSRRALTPSSPLLRPGDN